MKRLLLAATILSSCSRPTPQPQESPEILSQHWLQNAIPALSQDNKGWHFIYEGGSASSGISEMMVRIVLDGMTYNQAMTEFESLTIARVKSLGYTTPGAGEFHSGNILTGFSISVKTPDTTGIIVVSSAPIDNDSIVVAIAISQQVK